jgi:hypothetical protein
MSGRGLDVKKDVKKDVKQARRAGRSERRGRLPRPVSVSEKSFSMLERGWTSRARGRGSVEDISTEGLPGCLGESSGRRMDRKEKDGLGRSGRLREKPSCWIDERERESEAGDFSRVNCTCVDNQVRARG